MTSIVNVFDVDIATFSYIISSESVPFWDAFFLFSSLLYTASFSFLLLATGTALLFRGGKGYDVSVYRLAIYSLLLISLYTTLQIITGPEQEDLIYLSSFIVVTLFFTLIIYFCLKDEEAFNWRNIKADDAATLLCVKVGVIFIVLIMAISFYLAHRQ